MTNAVNIAQGGSNDTTMRNRLINGAMVIDQRNAGAAFGTSINGFCVDRWNMQVSVTGKINGGQNYNSATLPAGFGNYVGFQSQSAYSLVAGSYFQLLQPIEAFNTADFQWGTANAKTVTLSFVVQSSLTGTFGGSLVNAAQNRSYPFTYTISSANTWTTVSITIPGDTSGTWASATNGVGVNVNFSLGMGTTYSGTAGAWASGFYISATGATSVVGTNGATFYITGIQLEAGTTASPFENVLYGTELALCQRYYFQKATGDTIFGIPCPYNLNGGNQWLLYWLPQVMRAVPTVTSGSWVAGAPSSTYPGYRNIAFNFQASTYYMNDGTTLTVSAEL